MVIFHSYVSLPEGTSLLGKPMYIYRIYIGYLKRELGAIGWDFSCQVFDSSTVDGCEILHHQKDGWNPMNNGINWINHLSNGAGFFQSTVGSVKLYVPQMENLHH